MVIDVSALGQALEAGMLLCFGVSWPVDVMKTLRTRRTEGKSLAFMSLVLTGYVLGLSGKMAKATGPGALLEWVAALYVFNAVIIIVDIVITMRIRKTVAGRL